MSANKQIGWSQESNLLHAVSKQLERLAGLIAGGGGGGGTITLTTIGTTGPAVLTGTTLNVPVYVSGGAVSNGFLRTSDSLSLTTTLKVISDNSNVQSRLRLSTTAVTNFGGGNVATNTAFGLDALLSNTTGAENTAIGINTLRSNIAGNYNTAVGSGSLQNYNTAGTTNNTAVGAYSMYLSTGGVANAAFGMQAMQNHTIGNRNTAIGSGCGFNLTSGSENTGLGYTALGGISLGLMTGSRNICLGYQAGRDITTGSTNLIIENTTNASVTTGNNNIILDPVHQCGIHTGSNNVVIGGYNNTIPEGSDRIFIGTGNGVTRMAFDATGQMTIVTAPTAATGATTEKVLVWDSTAGAVKTANYGAKRVVTVAYAASMAPNAGTTDIFRVSPVTGNLAFTAPTGVKTDGQMILVHLLSDATIRTLTFPIAGAGEYAATTEASLPTATIASKWIKILFMYNVTLDRWECISVVNSL